ncbi:hypothetical protein CHUAL_009355 [Chamberlinius hualienensis]
MVKMCKSKARLDGKTVIITGANTGIGLETAKDLVGRGARVVMACRDLAKADGAAKEVAAMAPDRPNAVAVRKLDLASFKSIRKFAEEILNDTDIPRIDILINNAGIMYCPRWTTEDGFEMQFGVNHLGHFLLTNLLLDRIRESAPARIVNVSSMAHLWGKIHFDDLNWEKKYDSKYAYCQSKLANILFTKELTRRLDGSGVTTYSLHPGAVRTELQRHTKEMLGTVLDTVSGVAARLFFKTPVQGAQTSIYCAVDEELINKSGLYYSDCAEKAPSSRALDEDVARRLWDVSCKLVGLEDK